MCDRIGTDENIIKFTGSEMQNYTRYLRQNSNRSRRLKERLAWPIRELRPKLTTVRVYLNRNIRSFLGTVDVPVAGDSPLEP